MSSRDRSIVGVVILIIVAVGGYFLLVKPPHNRSKQLQSQINTEQAALTQAEQQVQAGLVAETESKAYAVQLKAIGTAVPTDEQIPGFINELQAASNKDKVDFEAIQPASATGTNPALATAASGTAATPSSATATGLTTTTSFPSESFELSLTGTYYSVTNLLGTLASFVHADDKHFKATGRLISITSVSYSGGTGTSGSVARPGDVTASVDVADYDIPTTLLAGESTSTATP